MPVLLDSRRENKTHLKVPASQLLLQNCTNYQAVNPLEVSDISSSFCGSLARFMSMASLSGVWKPLLDITYYINT